MTVPVVKSCQSQVYRVFEPWIVSEQLGYSSAHLVVRDDWSCVGGTSLWLSLAGLVICGM